MTRKVRKPSPIFGSGVFDCAAMGEINEIANPNSECGPEVVEMHFCLDDIPMLTRLHTWLGKAIRYLEAKEGK